MRLGVRRYLPAISLDSKSFILRKMSEVKGYKVFARDVIRQKQLCFKASVLRGMLGSLRIQLDLIFHSFQIGKVLIYHFRPPGVSSSQAWAPLGLNQGDTNSENTIL